MKKIISIIGARPQFIKHAPIQLQLDKTAIAKTIHTGQHYDANMSEVFFNELNIPQPDYKLQLTAKSHGGQTAEMMVKIEEILLQESPDGVLVYGDTNSTLAGALVAAKINIPIIHIEAGLRSFNRQMPEEVNRILTDHVSALLFAPSQLAVDNLRNEGIVKNVFLCGDVMKDMLKIAAPFIKDPSVGVPYFFATLHRPYNTDEADRLASILAMLQELPQKVVFPVHPRTIHKMNDFGINISDYSNIITISPVGYFDSLSYQHFSSGVITDSGGMQKEAYWLKKKCVTVRTETEWTETLEHGWNNLVFNDLSTIRHYLESPLPAEYDENLYGSYQNAAEIVQLIEQHLA